MGLLQLSDVTYQEIKESRGIRPKACETGFAILMYHERMRFLAILERDNAIPEWGSICGVCSAVHETKWFSQDALLQGSKTRKCLGSTGQVWICPWTALDFNQIEPFNREYRRLCSKHCGHRGPITCSPLHTSWPLVHVEDRRLPSKRVVDSLLGQFDAHVCPHLRLKSSFVSSLYNQDCAQIGWKRAKKDSSSTPKCKCFACTSTQATCPSCGTEIGFEIDYDDSTEKRFS